MTVDPETLMAYADGELDPLLAKRVERAMRDDPALAAEVERHRRLRRQLADGFAPVAAEPVPERLTSRVTGSVVSLVDARRPASISWQVAAAMAACLTLGVVSGRLLPHGAIVEQDNRLYASADLAEALQQQVGGAGASVSIPVSFRDQGGAYCRVFSSGATDGIACRDDRGWRLRRTQESGPVAMPRGGYRQAGSVSPDLMSAAQEMMAGAALDATSEKVARDADWKNGHDRR